MLGAARDVNLINNVVYGWGDQPTHRSEFGEVRINLVGNYYINGPMKKSDYIFNEAYPARTQLFHEGNMLDADQDGVHNGKRVGLADDIKRTFRQFDEYDSLLGPTHGKPFNFFATVAGKVVPAEDAYSRVTAEPAQAFRATRSTLELRRRLFIAPVRLSTPKKNSATRMGS